MLEAVKNWLWSLDIIVKDNMKKAHIGEQKVNEQVYWSIFRTVNNNA